MSGPSICGAKPFRPLFGHRGYEFNSRLTDMANEVTRGEGFELFRLGKQSMILESLLLC
jgi:hypothetical protein